LIGTGEATLEGQEATVGGRLEDFKRYLIGKNATDIGLHLRNLTRDPFWVGGYVAATALAAVEIALWDLLGQQLGVPVWQLLGGRIRDRVRVYANGWYFGVSSPEQWGERAGTVVELGYDALKFDPFGRAGPVLDRESHDHAVAVVEAVRQAVGPKTDLMIEAHGRFDVESAVRAARNLEPFACYWFEEPVPPGNATALADVSRRSPISVAAGERIHSRFDARELLTLNAVSVLQPDVVHTGGIVETCKIAALAETWFVPVAPHNPNGPVATAATLAVDAVLPNFLIQEMLAPWDVPWRDEVVEGSPRVIDGMLTIPDRPGLGVRLRHEHLSEHPYQPIDMSFYDENSILETVSLGEM
jgi:galactonate dehydratase